MFKDMKLYKVTFESGVILTTYASGVNKSHLQAIIEDNLQRYEYDMKVSKIEVLKDSEA